MRTSSQYHVPSECFPILMENHRGFEINVKFPCQQQQQFVLNPALVD